MIDAVTHGEVNDPSKRTPSGQPVPELPAWKAFVVQFSREAGSEAGIFAGRVEHLSSGRRSRFNSAGIPPDRAGPDGRAIQMMKLETSIHRSDRRRLRRSRNAALVMALLLASACVNIVAQNAPAAMQTVESRARFELNCPNVQATILSQKIVQGWRFDGSEHTIGVRGCGRQAVYVAYCADPSDCNAFSQTGRVSNLSNLMP